MKIYALIGLSTNPNVNIWAVKAWVNEQDGAEYMNGLCQKIESFKKRLEQACFSGHSIQQKTSMVKEEMNYGKYPDPHFIPGYNVHYNLMPIDLVDLNDTIKSLLQFQSDTPNGVVLDYIRD